MLDDTTYLHVQPCDTGWDYTLYDAATMKQLDGGQLDAPEHGPFRRCLATSARTLGLGDKSIKYAPLSMIETLQEAACQQMQEQQPTGRSCRHPAAGCPGTGVGRIPHAGPGADPG